MAVDDFSQKVSVLSECLEELKAEFLSNPANAPEILSDALKNLQASLDDLQVAKKVLKHQNEECAKSAEESTDALALAHSQQIHQIELEMQNEELKRAKLEIEEALTKYSDLYDFAPLGLFTIDEDGFIREVNLAGANLLGTERPFLLNKRFEQFITLKYRPIFNTFCREVRFSETEQKCELNLIKSTGEKIYVYIEGTATENRSINVEQIRIAAIDITEHKRAEDSLRQSEHRYRLLFETMLQGVIYQDADGKVFSINPAAEKILGKTKEELLDNPLSGHDHLAVHEDGSPFPGHEHPAAVSSRIKQPVRDVVMGVYNPKEKGYRWITIYAVPLFHQGDNKPCLIYTLIEDITERKRFEGALRKYNDELELRVQERIAELKCANEKLENINVKLIDEIKEHKKTENEMLKAKEAAEAASKAKAAFLANMSHEIRTPMNSVIGVTDLLLLDPLTPEQRDNLELIRINGDALLTIINDILDFSKLDDDRLGLEEQSFKLRQIVEEAMDMLAIKGSEKGLNLAYIIDKNVPDIIIGDPGRLRQVLGNMISNAVKFTDKGEVTLSVSCQQIEGTNEIHFAVQDTGIGISRDRMDQLFQPFSQMEPSTHRLYGGTGLGLAISKKLIELMDGKIWAESEVGNGSTFHFTVRAPTGGHEHMPSMASPIAIGKRILIVSKNKINRRILRRQIYDWGMAPMSSSSVDEALRWLHRGEEFDLAILDADIEDMGCLELEEEVSKYNKTLPLVFLTSPGQHMPPNHAYLTKPIKISQLEKVLTEILSRQPVQSTAQEITISEASQGKPRILLAEDNVSSQKIVQKMLDKLGYEVDIVANGLEALQVLGRQHYDVVLMDIAMPEMDGFEAARIIRQRWPDNGPKIIAITAYAIEGDREKCLEAGMNDYIAKPVKIEDLKIALKDISRL